MRENNRKSIASIKKFPQFTIMNVIDVQAGLIICASLIFYSLTTDNILNMIVLLILAGISISMLSGDNGILQRATDAKEYTERAEIVENAKLDILAKMSEKKGENLTAAELEEILTSSNYNTQGRLSNEENILERTLTSKNGKYQIPVSEIYNGTLTNTTPGVATDYSDEVKTALTEGKYITYRNKPYVVLYNNDDGIEIIAMETMGTVTLGANDETEGAQGTKGEFSRAQWSYNNAIQTLNKAAENLLTNDGIVDDARCVGSVPGKTGGVSNKNTRISTPYVEGVFGDFDVKFEQGEEIFNNSTRLEDNRNYTTDLNKLTELGIANINEPYYLASRRIDIYSPPEFGILIFSPSGEPSYFWFGEIHATEYIELSDVPPFRCSTNIPFSKWCKN